MRRRPVTAGPQPASETTDLRAGREEGRTRLKLASPPRQGLEIADVIDFVDAFATEISSAIDLSSPNPYLAMASHLIGNHLEGKTVTAASLVAAAGVPYTTATRKLSEMRTAGLIEHRPRSRTGKSFSLHPTAKLLDSWVQLGERLPRLARQHLLQPAAASIDADDQFVNSYAQGRTIRPPRVLPEAIQLSGGIRVLVHGDPTFMVMVNLKRQFEQIIGAKIQQRAFSIDALHHEALRNAERRVSLYDIMAVDLPWVGEFATRRILLALDDVMDVQRLDPSDFHTAGWRAAHWAGRPYGVPSQTTPEVLFYRRDRFAELGLEPPVTTKAVLDTARAFHKPSLGHYGIAWNAGRGTALGHTFLLTCADFGHPVLNLRKISGGFDADRLDRDDLVPQLDAARALEAAEYLLELMAVSPPDILSMSWHERIRPYAAGRVAMAYGYTLLAPYFELDRNSPAYEATGYLPHPAGPGATPVAPVGGYVLGIPANLPAERRAAAAEALIAFTSPEAQKLYVLNGSRTAPRYSVGADPEVRRLSPIFEAVDGMSWRDELQFWPRPPIPEISEIINICGEELHDMLRGVVIPRLALSKAQARAEQTMRRRNI